MKKTDGRKGAFFHPFSYEKYQKLRRLQISGSDGVLDVSLYESECGGWDDEISIYACIRYRFVTCVSCVSCFINVETYYLI